jgi:plasmid stabilization system protein ParE
MSAPVVFLPAARDDLDAAYVYYEQQRRGLGDQFAVAVRHRIDAIQKQLLACGVIYNDIRAAPVQRFPYVIYYPLETERILVVAVQHGSRDWISWQPRA